MHELLAKLDQLARSQVPVLITGETGVGKEVIARELHRRTFGPNAPFLPYNCRAVPADMLDAQLFGHKRGAFTGATENFPGVIRSAAGGTLLLDEIGELGMEIQPKLLRFLDSGEVHPIGEPRPVQVGVRIVAATNVDLERMVREGRFREDLYYRLNVVPLPVPALRERREEIPVLTDHYLDRYAQEMKRARLRVTDDALEYLLLYRWPGNVRQLANELRRIVALAPAGADLVPEMLSDEIRASRRTVDASQPPVGPNEIVVRIDQSLEEACAQVERVMIERALARHDGHLEQAAAALGISRKGLFLKRKRLGLAV
jgi:DNA-binding NtrC family response regulator